MAESARENRGVEFASPAATALAPADIRNAAFATTRLRTGYDMDEVDAFLDMVEERLAVLIAELQRAQDSEAQYRAQYEQLRARMGSAAPTTVVRAESPQSTSSGQAQAQAQAQALLIRQSLIAQLREHIGQVESQIRSVQASVDSAAAVGVVGVVATVTADDMPATVPAPAGVEARPQSDGASGVDATVAPRIGAPRARGPVPPEATQEIPALPQSQIPEV